MGFPRVFILFFFFSSSFLQTKYPTTIKERKERKKKEEAVLTLLCEDSVTCMFKGRDQPQCDGMYTRHLGSSNANSNFAWTCRKSEIPLFQDTGYCAPDIYLVAMVSSHTIYSTTSTHAEVHLDFSASLDCFVVAFLCFQCRVEF